MLCAFEAVGSSGLLDLRRRVSPVLAFALDGACPESTGFGRSWAWGHVFPLLAGRAAVPPGALLWGGGGGGWWGAWGEGQRLGS